MAGPLSGVLVLDAATFLAAPFCATLLAEFGATVIKIEQPGAGDSLRKLGTPSASGDSFIWMSDSRNKTSITLDLRTPEGAELFRKLAARAAVVVENFRPGTMDGWGIGYAALAKLNPKLVMLSVSAYGQSGPYKDMPGFARIAHAFSGLALLAGEPGRPPVVPGSTSLADYMSGLFGAIGVLMALRHADKTGEGQLVDIALYESIFRILDELAPAYAATGAQRERTGADIGYVVPHSHYQTGDGAWVAIACSNDKMWQRLMRAMGIAGDPELATNAQRVKRRDDVNGLVGKWVGSMPLAQVQEICTREEVPCAKLLSIADIFADPQYRARENLQNVNDPRAGKLTVPAPVPRLSKTPGEITHLGPALGDGTDDIYGKMLGLSAAEIADLKQRGII